MHIVFTSSKYILKRQGLSISGKYRLLDEKNNPLLYVAEKTKFIPLSKTIFAYADDKKTQLVLEIRFNSSPGSADYDVIDATNGEKVGSLGSAVENLSDIVKDKWMIYDGVGNPIAKMSEKSTRRAVLRELVDHALPQKLEINFGGTPVCEIRQKVTMLGYEASIDFGMDTGNLLDRRLGVASAILAAMHQGTEEL